MICQAVRVVGIRKGQTGEDEGPNCGTCNAPRRVAQVSSASELNVWMS